MPRKLSPTSIEAAAPSEGMEVDWDLQAVVRGCTLAAADPPPRFVSINPPDHHHHYSDDFGWVDQRNKLRPRINDEPPPPPPPPPQPQEELFDLFSPSISPPLIFPADQPRNRNNTTAAATPRSKRRRNQFKKVCEVPAEALSSSGDDTWSWRKYGQKPIKGSPYPRGYYRCSSSKGCPARKQVERNRSDPTMFLLTYTAEHNHPAPTHRHHHKLSLLPISKPANSTSSVPTSPSDDDDPQVHQSIKTEHKDRRNSK